MRIQRIEREVLPLSVKKGHWDLVEHLLAKYDDSSMRCLEIFELLEEIVPSLDECLTIHILRLPIVQSTLYDAMMQQMKKQRSIVIVEELERIDVLRSYIFAFCYQSPAADASLWASVMKRYRDNETWKNSRAAFLVQRRKLGLPDHMGWRIAQNLNVFDGDTIVKAVCPWRRKVCDCSDSSELAADVDSDKMFGSSDY
ncbi:hypothetical protein AC1031_013482 [Aphanomyces cochlioides]|nr:hypothetical protein AC1031_013482 [Aphanomyces cochlioides]